MSKLENKESHPLSIPELFELISKKPHDAAFKILMKHKEVSVPYLQSKLPGRKEGILLSAKRMLEKGYSPEVIADLLELSLEEVKALKDK